MKYKITLTFAIIVFFIQFAKAQAVITNLLNEELYDARVKLVDEFFDRFNLKELHPNIERDSNLSVNSILFLFDYEYLQSSKDSVFPMAMKFAKYVVSENVKISYSDTTWTAVAHCKGKLKGKPISLTLHLNVEHRSEDMYKWVITKAEGDILSLKPSFEDERIMLMPDDHETNFVSLRRITTEKDDIITNYRNKDYKLDQTAVFYSLVYYGLLDIDMVERLQFEFHQIPGYIFTVSKVNRETLNSGWLITKLENGD